MFSGLTDDEIHENIIWPDLPYLTDEHGGKLKGDVLLNYFTCCVSLWEQYSYLFLKIAIWHSDQIFTLR